MKSAGIKTTNRQSAVKFNRPKSCPHPRNIHIMENYEETLVADIHPDPLVPDIIMNYQSIH